jgi:hypothetical protein
LAFQNHKTARPRKRYYILASFFLMLSGWIFIGFDHYVGDHEVGTFWNPFIKSKPTLQVLFENPIVDRLEIAPLNTLSSETRLKFIEYCEIRWGISNTEDCHKKTERYMTY